MVLPQFGSSGKFTTKPSHSHSSRWILLISLAFNILGAAYWISQQQQGHHHLQSSNDHTVGVSRTWNGGHPADTRSGSCWCGGEDHYCMCTPNMAIDLVMVSGSSKDHIWVVQRKDTSQLATMGGFVTVDETAETAVQRELEEEMGIVLKEPPALLGVYSDPRRDNRRRTVGIVYVVVIPPELEEKIQAGDDAKAVRKIPLKDLEQYDFFADHRTILLDYRKSMEGLPFEASSEGDFASDIVRSTCEGWISWKQ